MSNSSSTSDPGGISTRLVVAVSAAWLISLFGHYAQTQLLGPIMREFGKGEEAVGWLFSLENTALAVSGLMIAGPLARWSRPRVAMIGGLVVVLANVASAFAWSFESLMVIRALAGIGTGVVGAAGTASAASAREPDRMFAAVTLVWGLAGAAEPTIIPYATVDYGTTGGYLLIAGICLMFLPLTLLPTSPQRSEGKKPSLWTAPNRVPAVDSSDCRGRFNRSMQHYLFYT